MKPRDAEPQMKKAKAIQRKRGVTIRARMALRARFKSVFAAIVRDLVAELDNTAKAASSSNDSKSSANAKRLDAIAVKHLDDEGLSSFVADRLTLVATDGVSLAMSQINETGSVALEQANELAISWANDHAAEMVQGVSQTTRDSLAELVSKAEAEGWSNADLSSEIQDSFGFSSKRADVIARTETATADVQGNLAAYKASGVETLQWITANDDKVSDECQMNDGEIRDIGDAFPSGATEPPGHPNCRCDVIPIFHSDEDGVD